MAEINSFPINTKTYEELDPITDAQATDSDGVLFFDESVGVMKRMTRGELFKGKVIPINSIADFPNLLVDTYDDRQQFHLNSFAPDGSSGGGPLMWAPDKPKSLHDGIRYFSPTVPIPADFNNVTDVQNYMDGVGEEFPTADGIFELTLYSIQSSEFPSIDGAFAIWDGPSGNQLKNGVVPSAIGLSALQIPNISEVGYARFNADETISMRTLVEHKADLQLNNVDNTSDADKPISIATQTELDLKAPLASPSLTGNPTAPTQPANSNDTTLANTAFVQGELTDRILSVETIADLRNLAGLTDGQKIQVTGYYSGSIKGGGLFTASTTDVVTADNDITVFVTTDGVRVYRDDVGVVTPFMGGAVGDGVADDTVAFNRCDSTSLDVYVPVATYIVEGATLTGKKMFGGGTLRWPDDADGSEPIIYMDEAAKLSGITIDGNKSNTSSVTGLYSTVLRAIGSNNQIESCTFINCPSTCITGYAGTTLNTMIRDCFFTRTNRYCVLANGSGWQVTGCKFYGTGINDGHAVRFGVFATDVVANPSVVVNGGLVSGCTFRYVNSVATLVELRAANITITGNHISYCTGFAKVENLSGEEGNGVVFSGNYVFNCKYIVNWDENTDTYTFGASSSGASFAGLNCNVSGNVFRETAGLVLGNDSQCDGNYFIGSGLTENDRLIVCLPTAGSKIFFRNNYIKMRSDVPLTSILNLTGGGGNEIENNHFDCNGALTGNAMTVSGSGDRIIGNTFLNVGVGLNFTSTATNTEARLNNFRSSVTTPINANTNTATHTIKDNVGADNAICNVTISNGVITIGGGVTRVRVDTEGGAATDDLLTISGGRPRQIVIFEPASSARDITFVNSTGNLEIGSDFTTTTTANKITLICNGTDWGQIFRV